MRDRRCPGGLRHDRLAPGEPPVVAEEVAEGGVDTEEAAGCLSRRYNSARHVKHSLGRPMYRAERQAVDRTSDPASGAGWSERASHRTLPRATGWRETSIPLILTRRRTVPRVVDRHTRFAQLLDRSGFDEGNIRYEVVGRVRHGPAGATPDCDNDDGAVALFANATLGWAVPGRAGWIEPSWISSWATAPGALTIDYQPRPVVVHYHDPDDLKVHFGSPARLQLCADEAGIAGLIRLAGASFPAPGR